MRSVLTQLEHLLSQPCLFLQHPEFYFGAHTRTDSAQFQVTAQGRMAVDQSRTDGLGKADVPFILKGFRDHSED